MIIGIGTDLVYIPRVVKLMDNDAFTAKLFTEEEIANAQCIKHPDRKAGYYAKRFAAKEAFAKALGTGFGEVVGFCDISISNDEAGAPKVNISSTVNDYLKSLCGSYPEYNIKISLTDEQAFAQAFVVIEAF